MRFLPTPIGGLQVIEPSVARDQRGYFYRQYCTEEFLREKVKFSIVQTNISTTKVKGSIRGMHFQHQPMAEAKLVSCIRGRIYDVALDLRNGSNTYGQWYGLELSEHNHKELLIPEGFAHGFQTLADDCLVHYCMSENYSPEHSGGVRWDDPRFAIKWPLKPTAMSEKDMTYSLKDSPQL